MRYCHFSEKDGAIKTLRIGLNILLLIVMVAFLGIAVHDYIQSHQHLLVYLFGIAFIIYAILYLIWDLSLYQVCPEGLVIKSLFITKTIKWSEIQRITISIIIESKLKTGSKKYITVFLNGSNKLALNDITYFFFIRKKVFIVRFTEERLAEFEKYCPEKICPHKK